MFHITLTDDEKKECLTNYILKIDIYAGRAMTFIIIIISIFSEHNIIESLHYYSIKWPIVYYRDNWSLSCPALAIEQWTLQVIIRNK